MFGVQQLLGVGGRRGTVPIVHDLGGEDGVEEEAGDEAVQNQLVIDLLQRGVDATQTAEEVVEDRERRQLAGAALVVDGEDLRQLAGDAQCARAGLQAGHLGVGDESVGDEERVDGAADRGDKGPRMRRLVGVHQDQDADDDVLDGNQTRLAVRAEGEPVAHVVRQRDDETRRFQQVAGEGQSLRRPGPDQLDDLRYFNHRGRRDNPNSQRLRDRERHAFRMRGKIEIEEEGAVA